MSVERTHPPRARRLVVAAALASATLYGGCLFGGQTGSDADPGRPKPPTAPSGGKGGAESPTNGDCSAKVTPVALDDGSALGFAANDVLALGVGAHSAELLWLPPPEGVSFGPEQGEGTIELTISYGGGEARVVVSEPSGGPSAGRAPLLGCSPPQLEVDVNASVRTGGGALQEAFAATLVANAPTSVRLSQGFGLKALNGSFVVTVPRDATADSLRIEATFGKGVFFGALWGDYSIQVGSGPNGTSGRATVQFAQWPFTRGEP